MKNKLMRILGMQPAVVAFTEHEMLARRTIRQYTCMGYEAYDMWRISEEMLEMSLNANSYPDLFPPNQRTARKVY